MAGLPQLGPFVVTPHPQNVSSVVSYGTDPSNFTTNVTGYAVTYNQVSSNYPSQPPKFPNR